LATQYNAYLVPSGYDFSSLDGVAGELNLPAELERFPKLEVIRSDDTNPLSPPFSTQPQSQIVKPGAHATFTVAAVGTAPIAYQWRKNGTPLAGATSASYIIASAQPGDAGSYSVVVSNVYGNATSWNASLLVSDASELPGIVTQPYFVWTPSQAVTGATANAGAIVEFIISALSNTPLSYQWRRNGVALAGATSSSLINLSITTSDAGTYDVIVSNGMGSITSSAVALSVNPPNGYSFWTFAGLAGQSGSTDGSGSDARFDSPQGVAVDRAGNVYVADFYNGTIRKITPKGMVSTLAGMAINSGSTDGFGSDARFNSPQGVAVDSAGNVFVADTYNDTIRKITPDGGVTTLAGLALSSGSTDGTGSAARFYYPEGVTVDSAGNVYVADTYNDTIRKITPAGVVSTVAGLAGNYGSTDGIGNTARFGFPSGVAVDSAGNLFVADTSYHTIRKITPAGVVSTLAGLTGQWGSTDGTGNAARFFNPQGVAVDSAGNVYVGDQYNHTIRKITPVDTMGTVTVTTLAGMAGLGGNSDGNGGNAHFHYPAGVAVDGAGNIYVADTWNDAIRKSGTAVSPQIQNQPQNQTVPLNQRVTFSVAATGLPAPICQWKKGTTTLTNGGNISGATSATLTLTNVQLTDAGSYTVVVTNSAGTITSSEATLTVYVPASAPPSQHVTPGTSVTFTVTIGSGSPTYQWKLNGNAIAGATSATYTIANAQSGNMGFYSVTVTNSAGSVDSAVAILTVSGGSSRLTALSTRGVAGAGASALTPGIALRGVGSKPLVVRGVGPTLGVPPPAGFGVPNTLSDPKLDVIPLGAATPVASNDDWSTNSNLDELRRIMAAVGAFPLIDGSKDAAVLATLATPNVVGNYLYTVPVTPSGTATSPGIALAEVYDTEGLTAPVKLIAVSTRGFTGPNEQVLTTGFWIVGDGPKQLLIRAVGPTLGVAPYNVPGVLADPQFVVIPLGKNFTVASNNDWGGTAELQAAFAQTSDFALPTGSKDAAVVVRLPPGGYTVQATGVGGTTGNVLVEIYDMDP